MPNTTMTTLSFEENLIMDGLERLLSRDYQNYLKRLLPEGHIVNGVFHAGQYRLDLLSKWVVPTYQNKPKPSSPMTHAHYLIGLAEGRDEFACSGVIHIFMRYYGLTPTEATKKICRCLELSYSSAMWFMQNGLDGHEEQFAVSADESVKLAIPELFVQKGFREVHRVFYRNLDGSVRSITVVLSDGSSSYCVPYVPYLSKATGLIRWEPGYSSQPILCKADSIIKDSYSAVLIVPGEVTMLNLEKGYSALLSSVSTTTWPGGRMEGTAKTDFSPLKNKRVIIFSEATREGYLKTHSLIQELIKHGVHSITVVSRRNSTVELQENKCVTEGMSKDLSVVFLDRQPQTVDEFYAEAKELFGLDLKPALDLTKPVSWEDPSNVESFHDDWIIEGFVRKGERVLMYAKKGQGKSWCGLFFGLVGANGSTSLLNPAQSSGKRYKVLLIDGENSLNTIKKRLMIFVSALKFPKSCLNQFDFCSAMDLRKGINLEDMQTRDALSNRIEAADIIILDNINCLWPSAMQSSPEGSAEFNSFVNELGLKGKTVIVVTHSPKNGDTAFGSSTKEFGVDVLINIKGQKAKTDGSFTFTISGTSRSAAPMKDLDITITSAPEGNPAVHIKGGSPCDNENLEVESSPCLAGQDTPCPASIDLPTKDIQDIVEPLPTVRDDLKKTLSDKEELALTIYQRGIRKYREIEDETKRLAGLGERGAVVISKSSVGKILKKLRDEGYIEAE